MYIYRLTGDELLEKRTMDHNGGITDVKYSPDGAFLVATDTYRKVVLYQLPEYNVSCQCNNRSVAITVCGAWYLSGRAGSQRTRV